MSLTWDAVARSDVTENLLTKVVSVTPVKRRQLRFFSRLEFRWLPSLFAIRGRSFPLGPLATYTIYSAAVIAVVNHFLTPQQQEYAKSLKDVETLISGLLVLLMSFRLNQSYSRWWEGRKTWEGVRDGCVNIARLAHVHYPDKSHARKIVAYASVFPAVMQADLHHDKELVLNGELSVEEEQQIACAIHMPMYVLCKLTELVNQTDNFHKMHMMEAHIQRLNAAITKTNTVRATTVPFCYVTLLRTLAVMFLSLLPWIMTPTYSWFTLAATFFVAFPWFTCETVSCEIEAPFGTDFNDLRLNELNADIAQLMDMFMDVAPTHGPEQHFDVTPFAPASVAQREP